MNNNYNPFNRLQIYITYFSNQSESIVEDYEYGCSIAKLNQISKIPIEVIRNDIFFIQSRSTNLGLTLDDEYPDFIKLDKKYNLQDLWAAPDSESQAIIQKLILNGTLDHIPIFINQRDIFSLPLNTSEFNALQMWREDESNQKLNLPFTVKDSFRFFKNSLFLDILDKITITLQQDLCLSFNYINNKGNQKLYKIKPLKLLYDSMENEFAIFTITKEPLVFHLNKLQNLEIINENITIGKKHLHYLDRIDQVWGMAFTDKGYEVKVKFYKGTQNIWSKVRRDLSYRTKGKLYEKQGFLYYEDTVYGLKAFESWVRLFGAAAIVEQPAELRESIITSLKERLSIYSEQN